MEMLICIIISIAIILLVMYLWHLKTNSKFPYDGKFVKGCFKIDMPPSEWSQLEKAKYLANNWCEIKLKLQDNRIIIDDHAFPEMQLVERQNNRGKLVMSFSYNGQFGACCFKNNVTLSPCLTGQDKELVILCGDVYKNLRKVVFLSGKIANFTNS